MPRVTDANSLLVQSPALAAQYHSKNTVSAEELAVNSHRRVWWICDKGHEWEAAVSTRSRGSSCPYCSGRRATSANSLVVQNPELASQYHPTKNTMPIEELTVRSGKDVWWICARGHEWKTSVDNRSNGRGCPYCAGKRVTEKNSLSTRSPTVAAQYHPTKNTTPAEAVAVRSHKKVWWICDKGHEWEAAVSSRATGCGCPYCAGHLVTDANSLLIQYPTLAAQYHPTKNTLALESLTVKSNSRVWWICDSGHEWEAYAYSRTGGSGCPVCCRTHSGLSCALESLCGVGRFDRFVYPSRSDLPYRPDVKLSDTVYANADGLYWHSVREKAPRYHFNMRRDFEAKGLRLLQFYEDEIVNKPRIVRSIVNAILGRTPDKIMARKCTVGKVSSTDADIFLDANHLIGKAYQCRFVGLHLDGKLVQVMAYRIQGNVLEIARSAGLLDTTIAGGFQRLLCHVTKMHAPKTVKTLVDLRYADGHSLEKAGFSRTGVTMNYQYTDSVSRKDKRQFRVRAGTDESAAAAARGWFRIYDAGKAQYRLTAVR